MYFLKKYPMEDDTIEALIHSIQSAVSEFCNKNSINAVVHSHTWITTKQNSFIARLKRRLIQNYRPQVAQFQFHVAD
ncbi:hypothetical protein MXB_1402, partial [Myxobolus squamalis]